MPESESDESNTPTEMTLEELRALVLELRAKGIHGRKSAETQVTRIAITKLRHLIALQAGLLAFAVSVIAIAGHFGLN